MTITWFKHHHGAALDAKWLAVADMAGSTPANVWSVFSGALEYASDHDDRGSTVGLNPQVLASFYRIAVGEVRQVLGALKEIGVIVGDRIAKWAKRQGTNLGSAARPVSAGALRMRRLRAKRAADPRQGSLDLVAGVTSPAPGVTAGVTEGVTSATDLERDRENPSVVPPRGDEPLFARAPAADQPRAAFQRSLPLVISGGANGSEKPPRRRREPTAREAHSAACAELAIALGNSDVWRNRRPIGSRMAAASSG
jgi:hypothetical protein